MIYNTSSPQETATDDLDISDDTYTAVNYVNETLKTVNAKTVAKETKTDKTSSKIMLYVHDAWPKANDLSDIEKIIYAKRDELF